MDFLSIGQSVLSAVQRAAGKAQAEVFLLESESRSSDWSEGRPENRVVAQARGMILASAIQNSVWPMSFQPELTSAHQPAGSMPSFFIALTSRTSTATRSFFKAPARRANSSG